MISLVQIVLSPHEGCQGLFHGKFDKRLIDALPRHPVCGGSRRLTRGWASRNEGHRRLDKVGVNAAGRDADSLPKTISSVESEPCLESRTDGPSYLRYLNMAVHSSTLRVTPFCTPHKPRWRTLLGICDLLRRFFSLSLSLFFLWK